MTLFGLLAQFQLVDQETEFPEALISVEVSLPTPDAIIWVSNRVNANMALIDIQTPHRF